ncbi:hypothetical protein C1645_792416 [Glomus cerebriforme]|uniref:Transmembrane protein n=1 Tax=Glomus cerebriforme TaxID=658196 RepID=A0A397S875_9GLOM|nr:hypothetical protein C1645_792416 [Glomus cerebriforme]
MKSLKSFKIIIALFIITFVVLINLTVDVNAFPLPNDPKLCSNGCNFFTKRDEGNPTSSNPSPNNGDQSLPTGNASDTDIIAPSSPDYNGSQIKKLAIPIGVVFGIIVGSAFVFLVWKWCFKPTESK